MIFSATACDNLGALVSSFFFVHFTSFLLMTKTDRIMIPLAAIVVGVAAWFVVGDGVEQLSSWSSHQRKGGVRNSHPVYIHQQ